ncbi:MAG: hypothetical protein SVX43_13570 [Cyanobacteriota bacterium]|nr:hypothetical protein [Cyanobacteriota bacterium]
MKFKSALMVGCTTAATVLGTFLGGATSAMAASLWGSFDWVSGGDSGTATFHLIDGDPNDGFLGGSDGTVDGLPGGSSIEVDAWFKSFTTEVDLLGNEFEQKEVGILGGLFEIGFLFKDGKFDSGQIISPPGSAGSVIATITDAKHTPEPVSTLAFLGLGVIGVGALSKRKSNRGN